MTSRWYHICGTVGLILLFLFNSTISDDEGSSSAQDFPHTCAKVSFYVFKVVLKPVILECPDVCKIQKSLYEYAYSTQTDICNMGVDTCICLSAEEIQSPQSPTRGDKGKGKAVQNMGPVPIVPEPFATWDAVVHSVAPGGTSSHLPELQRRMNDIAVYLANKYTTYAQDEAESSNKRAAHSSAGTSSRKRPRMDELPDLNRAPGVEVCKCSLSIEYLQYGIPSVGTVSSAYWFTFAGAEPHICNLQIAAKRHALDGWLVGYAGSTSPGPYAIHSRPFECQHPLPFEELGPRLCDINPPESQCRLVHALPDLARNRDIPVGADQVEQTIPSENHAQSNLRKESEGYTIQTLASTANDTADNIFTQSENYDSQQYSLDSLEVFESDTSTSDDDTDFSSDLSDWSDDSSEGSSTADDDTDVS